MLNSDSQKVMPRIYKSELEIDFKFSNLRHTHVTLLASMNVDPEFVRVRLRHTKITTALRYYIHTISPIDESIINKVDNIIN